ncbi:hypothetical protein ACTQ1O_06605 [Bilifractor sp. LCP21S3_A7]|uniref:hypothetical protein n=1 Tax=Bilifractor sp. LCP21S3_A7 TaxID=3438738 RepID=UPI003F8E7FE4
MNKVIPLVTASVLSFACLISGCAGNSENSVNMIDVDTLPSDITLKGTEMKVTKIDLYQNRSSEQGHPYSFAAVITIDRSKINDDDLYWLLNRDDGTNPLTADCYLTSEKNDIEFESVPKVSDYYDNDNLYFIFFDYDNECRYALTDAELSFDINAEQLDTYTYKGNEYHKTTCYSYSVNHDYSKIKLKMKDLSDMPLAQFTQLYKGVKADADFYNGLANAESN